MGYFDKYCSVVFLWYNGIPVLSILSWTVYVIFLFFSFFVGQNVGVNVCAFLN